MAITVRRILTAALTVALVGTVGYLSVPRFASASTAREPRWYDQFLTRQTVPITGTVWDFYKKNKREMDPDFDNKEPKFGKGQYCGVFKQKLDADGRPEFSGGGYLVETTWNDAANRPIIWPKSYIETRPGDQPGKSPKKAIKDKGDAVTPEEDVAGWFRDSDDNETYEATISFARQSVDGTYLFDSQVPKGSKHNRPKKGQDDILGLIASGKYKKKRYTFAGETTFVYEKGTGWWLTAAAQDDVWVYIDGKMVIDLGGAYKHKEKKPFGAQTIELDRLGWLQDGGTYTLKIFMADRDKGSEKSHLKVHTSIPTLNLVGPNIPRAQYD